MGRQVRCEICGMLLGDIREAKLHKNIKYLCSDCLDEICPRDEINTEYNNTYVNKHSEEFVDFFSKLFTKV